MAYLRALKSQLSLAQEKSGKTTNYKQKPSSSEESARTIVREGSPGVRGGEGVKLRREGFVKQVGFKPGVRLLHVFCIIVNQCHFHM